MSPGTAEQDIEQAALDHLQKDGLVLGELWDRVYESYYGDGKSKYTEPALR